MVTDSKILKKLKEYGIMRNPNPGEIEQMKKWLESEENAKFFFKQPKSNKPPGYAWRRKKTL